MTWITGWVEHTSSWWLVVAMVLGIAEIVVPGVFLIFLAGAALAMAGVALIVPGLSVTLQLLLFAALSGATVAIGRRFYRDNPVASADPLLNDRAARLVGEIVTVTQPVVDGRGKVRVADGEWLAEGGDAALGAKVRIVGANGAILRVEPVA